MTVIKMIFVALTMFCFYKIDAGGGLKYIFTGVASFITSALLCLTELLNKTH